MTRPKRARYRVKASRTTNTYVYCHAAARQALAQAEREQAGFFYSCMIAGVFAAFTVEAYLNHLGQERVKGWDILERRLSLRDKLALLCQHLQLSVDHSKPPFQTLTSMLRLRDALAHGKTETVVSDAVVDHRPGDGDRWPDPEWVSLCSVDSARRMVRDSEAMVRDLSTRSGSSGDPFESSGHGSGGVSLVEEN